MEAKKKKMGAMKKSAGGQKTYTKPLGKGAPRKPVKRK